MTTSSRWSPEQAWQWYNQRPWLCGCNYLPATAVNFIEFWRKETFDLPTIGRELALAASIGFNTLRVNLIFELWEAQPVAVLDNLEKFLEVADANGLVTMLVFFDDCGGKGIEPNGQAQLPPIPGIHNSRQVSSPSQAMVVNPREWPRLEKYLTTTMKRFARDPRVLCWDIYNEPGQVKLETKSLPLLVESFAWARSASPEQPLTTGVWSEGKGFAELAAVSYEMSDVISFHHYGPIAETQAWVERMKKLGRPLLCTEWLARTLDSRVETHLDYFRAEKIGCYNWGFVNGKTQTHVPWEHLGHGHRNIWFHDLFLPDGTPYAPGEIEAFRNITALGGTRTKNA